MAATHECIVCHVSTEGSEPFRIYLHETGKVYEVCTTHDLEKICPGEDKLKRYIMETMKISRLTASLLLLDPTFIVPLPDMTALDTFSEEAKQYEKLYKPSLFDDTPQ